VSTGRIKARFIEPMESLPVSKLPEGAMWTWEIKLDGWRMEVVKTGGSVTLYSRRGKNFNAQFGYIARELAYLPDEICLAKEYNLRKTSLGSPANGGCLYLIRKGGQRVCSSLAEEARRLQPRKLGRLERYSALCGIARRKFGWYRSSR